MVKNPKFDFTDQYFATAFLILVSVGWFSLALSGGATDRLTSANRGASLAPGAMRSAEVKTSNANQAKINKLANRERISLAARASTDLSALTSEINALAGSNVIVFDETGPIQKLNINADFILLTDRRPRVSLEKSNLIAPAIVEFSARKNVVAYIDHTAAVPESHLRALENYIQSYASLTVERRLSTTIQNQLELSLEVQ